MWTRALASEYDFFLNFWTQLSAKELVNNVGIKMVEYKISGFTLYFTKSLLSPIHVRWVLDSSVGKIKAHVLKSCAHKEWKLLILKFPHFRFFYLIILSSALTEIIWKPMRNPRTTVMNIRRNTLWKQPQKRISITYTKITWGHPFNCKVREKLK